MEAPHRFDSSSLTSFATDLMTRSGLSEERACVVAEVLVEGDLMGHDTHGLQLLGPFLQSIEDGSMCLEGEPEVVAETMVSFTWDGNYLPGPWLVREALKKALSKIEEQGVVTGVIRRSHHIACLQAYLLQAVEAGKVLLIASSDPACQAVAPFGGLKPLYTPNPLAMGIPTVGDPILIDISSSITTNGMVARHQKEGKRLPGDWVKNPDGEATTDPRVLFSNPPGAILPLGGLEYGHKGFGLGIMIEALTSALAGGGRSKGVENWGASVFLQLIDPEAFGGLDHFLEETTWFQKAARENPVRPGDPSVRLPGERALSRRRDQLQNGLQLYPGVLSSLRSLSKKQNIPIPNPL